MYYNTMLFSILYLFSRGRTTGGLIVSLPVIDTITTMLKLSKVNLQHYAILNWIHLVSCRWTPPPNFHTFSYIDQPLSSTSKYIVTCTWLCWLTDRCIVLILGLSEHRSYLIAVRKVSYRNKITRISQIACHAFNPDFFRSSTVPPLAKRPQKNVCTSWF